ncbi:L10-interacting MYB domain-containing protein-like [Telopea speciosissima]|uniref:L10-interacting MYB domain-containing protein-like n=1 Tax=Telopea speciosissima TaxID=54955 RepID=UPI001CC6B239|nr:L10-interacting MYB domain-containing protein-like [Telopea speciosissima]
MATTSNKDCESATWRKDEVDAFVKCMVEEVKKGNKTTSTFNKVGWNNIKTQLEAKLGRTFVMLQLRNKMNKLRRDYRSFKKLLETSGFGWNLVTRTCTVEDDGIWEKHIKENPSWSRFKRIGLPQWPELQMIYGDSYSSAIEGVGNAQDHNLDEEDEFVMGMGESDGDGDALSVTHQLDKTPNAAIRKRSMTTDLAEAIMNMCDVSRAKMQRYTSSASPSLRSGSTDYSLRECIKVLEAMPEIGKELYMKAVRKMMDSQPWREAFICLPMEKKMWLLE